MLLFLQAQMVPEHKENGRTWGEANSGTTAYEGRKLKLSTGFDGSIVEVVPFR